MPESKPGTTNVSVVPVILGSGSSVHCIASSHVVSFTSVALYLISYSVAVPRVPLSPGAVHVSVIRFYVGSLATRSVTAFGAQSSSVFPEATLEIVGDQLGISSAVFIAK